MKIVLLSHSYPPSIGGVATSVKRLAVMLKEKGFSVFISTLSGKLLPGQEQEHIEDGILSYHLGKFPGTSDTRASWFEQLCRIIDKHKIDIVHSYYASRAGFTGTMAAKLKGINSIVSIRGNDLEKDMFCGSNFPLIEWTLKNCSYVTCVSKNLKSLASIIIPEKKIEVIYNSVNTSIFKKELRNREILSDLSIQEGEPVTGFIGEGKAKKGIYSLLKAFSLVLERRKSHLFLIGTMRREMADMIKYFREENQLFNHYLHIVPPVLPEYIPKFYNLLDIFIMPSLRDGMPNGILEAMACELPVVTTSAGAIPELVKNEKTGIIVEPGNIDNLTSSMIKLIDSKELREKMGKKGRERVIKYFSQSKEVEGNIKIYNKLVKS
ncbi:MAG: glycosyltransferase family 4 protein [Candidatus Eremiobacterota bacterium]